jgi:hypothetical protein
MSDVGEERPHGWLYRSMVPGRPSGTRPAKVDIALLWAPGRAALEIAVILAALAIIVPIVAAPAVLFAMRARRRGHPRWLAVAGASVWCAFLGIAVRVGLGLGFVP